MAATVKDDSIARSVMFLCLGTSLLLLIIQWRVWVSGSSMSSAHAGVLESRRANVKRKPTAFSKANSSKPTSKATAPGNPNLVVDLSDRRVYVYKNGKQLTSYPLAVGQVGWETPTGQFQVIEMQHDPQWLHPITREIFPAGPDNPLGKRWIGFWSDGYTHIGFHGTNQEELIGLAISHGCLRMRNQDVMALYDMVSEGTPVVVRQ